MPQRLTFPLIRYIIIIGELCWDTPPEDMKPLYRKGLIDMGNLRIASIAASLCLIAGCVPAYCSGITNISAYAAADSNTITQDINFNSIGEVAELKLASSVSAPEWSSSDTNVAVVTATGNNKAEITAVGKGSAVVCCVIGDNLLKYNVTVPDKTAPVVQHVGDITLDNTNNAAQADLKGVAKGSAVWSSSDDNVAKVDQNGGIIAVGKGSCIVSAVAGEVTYTINVSSNYDPSIPVPTGSAEVIMETITLTNQNPKRTITAENLPDGTKLEWFSSDENVASVDSDGNISAVGTGRCRVYVSIGGRRFIWEIVSQFDPDAKAAPAVIGSVTLDADSPSKKLSVTGITDNKSVKWSSDDTSIAEVDSDGIVTAKGKGKCTITAVTADDKTFLIEIVSDCVPASGAEPAFVLEGIGAKTNIITDSTSGKPEYMSMNKDIVTVDDKGCITAVGIGETSVILTVDGNSRILKVRVDAVKLIGDANCDGKVSLADALAILQFVANETKYPLSEQGLANAEAYGNDGITAKDSLAVQMYETGEVSELPIIE